MSTLSWPAVQYCMEALRSPIRRDEAVKAVATAGGIRMSTARDYLRTAERLGLVQETPDRRISLRLDVRRPQELIAGSTLIRLFRAWQRTKPLPFEHLDNGTTLFEPFKSDERWLLGSADALARRLTGPDDLSPQCAILLEMTRLWTETRGATVMTPMLSAAVAFRSFKGLVASSADVHDDPTHLFVSACMSLYGKRLVRLGIVQYAHEANLPFAPFRTSIGYIKWLHTPVPYEGMPDVKSVQTSRKFVSFA